MRTVTLLVLALSMAGCFETEVGRSEEALEVCFPDCSICFPSCHEPCPDHCYACPVVENFYSPGNWLPIGEYHGFWTCLEGCKEPVHELTEATTMLLVPGGAMGQMEVVWQRVGVPATIEKAKLVQSAPNCWRQAGNDFAWCRSELDICGVTEPQSGNQYVVAGVTWTGLFSGVSQRWTWTQPPI